MTTLAALPTLFAIASILLGAEPMVLTMAICAALAVPSLGLYTRRAKRMSSISNFEITSRQRTSASAFGLVHSAAVISTVCLGLHLSLKNTPFSSVFAYGFILACVCWLYELCHQAVGQYRSNGVSPAKMKAVRQHLANTHAPVFAFYFAHGGLDAPLHYLIWKDYLDGLEKPYMVIIRERKHLAHFVDAKYKNIPVVLITAPENLKDVLPSSVKTIFYANNGFKNVDMINAAPKLRHVQLLHGDSDKATSYNPAVRCFTDLFVSGQMAIDRYVNNGVFIPPHNISVVGRPQASDIQIVDTIESKDSITIGFMPTWMGYHQETQFSSLKIAADIVERILNHNFGKKVHVLFKPHPLSHADPLSLEFFEAIKGKMAAGGINSAEFMDRHTDAISVFNMSDILISDISSVVIDFLYSKKPYLITNTNDFNLNDLTKYPCVEGGYLLHPDASNVIELLTEAMTQDELKSRRMDLRDYAFGDSHMAPGTLFKEKCLEIINR